MRDYLFHHVGLGRDLRSGALLIVGRDPWDDSEPGRWPKFFSGDYPHLAIVTGGTVPDRKATAEECFGLERLSIYDKETVIARIMQGEEGPIAREDWPILPDRDHKPKYMRWQDWDPANAKGYVYNEFEIMRVRSRG
jgi:hypothetical protein